MSFLGVKVILFLVIPLIIKEKSNASALDRYEITFTWVYHNFSIVSAPLFHCFYPTFPLCSRNIHLFFLKHFTCY